MPIFPPTKFVLDGQEYEFIRPERVGPVEDVKSWEMGNYPKVHARVPLKPGGTVWVYAHATHWNRTQIHVQWYDDEKDSLSAWLPKEDVRPVTNSDWDIDAYNRCPEWLRVVQWGAKFEHRLPGFLPL
ncbi:hypothetical protein SAMN04487912_102327 [Arthrobacter sp. cf158]|uniref:hypothetical protein n=1 Tax=Arthrobacter sp. cf158 TaxID=1761744 RepID=UPI00089C5FE8|nr:hypothetical protein [Arthrobacter sp. cf158]SDW32452.1 hypothetical protein SAMN04487912_102327 [Arthrobacter sp. cf158]